MMTLFRNAKIYKDGSLQTLNMFYDGKTLHRAEGDLSAFDIASVFDNCVIIPGLCDVHVHLREPGFSYKETIETGTRASARGGYTAVCAMPNLSPAPDTVEHIDEELAIIERDACIKVYPYATITKGQMGEELTDMEGLAHKCIAFSDDGRGVQSEELMLAAMYRARANGKMIVAHCEDNSLLRGGYIHDGEYASCNGHRGICSESEWGPIKRDVALAKMSGCAYHVCHISTKESVDIIRRAKAEGVDVTCETGPHYILLDDYCLREDGRFKMNPPLRSPSDREAILEGVLDGTIDMIATDHAPHSEEEKSRGLEGSAMGIVGIETAFALMYTHLVRSGKMSLERLVFLMSESPRARFKIDSDPGFTVFDVESEYVIDPKEFLSKGRATPFEGERVFGRCRLTVYNGETVYEDLVK